MIYWGYTAFQAEQTMTRATIAPPAQKAGGAAPAVGSKPVAYRSALPLYFLVGFALVMTAILGSIIYFWWSLKDLEGGRRYGEEDEEVPAPDSDKEEVHHEVCLLAPDPDKVSAPLLSLRGDFRGMSKAPKSVTPARWRRGTTDSAPRPAPMSSAPRNSPAPCGCLRLYPRFSRPPRNRKGSPRNAR